MPKVKLRPGRKATPSKTSEAKVKRIREGLQPAPNLASSAGGHLRDLNAKATILSPDMRQKLAKEFAEKPGAKAQVMLSIISAEQKYMKELKEKIISSAPRAAAYLSDLVDGIHDSAPHAVRAGAASKIIDSAVTMYEKSSGNKDLSEMSASEIQAELMTLGNALAGRTAEDAEVIEEVVATARSGRSALE